MAALDSRAVGGSAAVLKKFSDDASNSDAEVSGFSAGRGL